MLDEAEAPVRPPSAVSKSIERVRGGALLSEDDWVAAEEPMEIRLAWSDGAAEQTTSIAITMRTPGDDFELAAGFLFGEQIITGRDDIVDVAYCVDEDVQAFNVVTVTLRSGLTFDRSRLERNFFTNSSCGVCGKATLESLEVVGCQALHDGFSIAASLVRELPDRLRANQELFASTGGLHAAGLFDAAGNLEDLREDVGRHNAVDKLIGGRVLGGGVPVGDRLLCLSGRASYELLQKALVAGIPVVAAVGAPSSLAVDLANTFNITLVGFVKRSGFNIYSGGQRLAS